MSNTAQVEPTEEQRQAAAAFVARHGEQNEVIDSGGQARLEWSPTHTADDIARLLAEREAKLQARIDDLTEELAATDTTEMRLRSEVDTLGARIAELEAQLHRHRSNRMSNIIKPSECSYPECGPACRKDCPPAASTKACVETMEVRDE